MRNKAKYDLVILRLSILVICCSIWTSLQSLMPFDFLVNYNTIYRIKYLIEKTKSAFSHFDTCSNDIESSKAIQYFPCKRNINRSLIYDYANSS